MSLSDRMERLSPREQRLVFALLGVFALVTVVILPVTLAAQRSSRASENDALRETLAAIAEARPQIARLQAEREAILRRYGKPAPALAGFLEQSATAQGIEIPESQDRPVVPHGKKYEERSTKIDLSKVGMRALSLFLESIAASPYPVRISGLTLRRRATETDSYDVSLIVSAFDRKDGTARAPGAGAASGPAAPVASAEESE